MLIFQLKKDYPMLAQAEVQLLLRARIEKSVGNLLFATASRAFFSRLALTRAVFEHMFTCSLREITEKIKFTNFNQYYEKDFKVVVHHAPDEIIPLANAVYRRLTNPKVNLTTPTTEFHFFFMGDIIVAGRLLAVPEQDFEKRKAQHRPSSHPSTMHPKLARLLINLTGVEHEMIVDPMCGSGGIVLEARSMDVPIKGYDIDEIMVRRAQQNLNYYNYDAEIIVADATIVKEPWLYVVTDVPYGKNTKKQDMMKLYIEFLWNVKQNLVHTAVLMFPHWVNTEELIKKTNLKIKHRFFWYIHKHLSRKILVVEK